MADNKDDDDFGDDFDGDFTPATIKTLKLDESDDSNELNDAIAALEAKVSADSSNADLKSQLAKAYINGAEAALLENDSQVAQGFLNKALALDANNPAVLFDLSRAYQLEEDHTKARDFLKQTLAKDPKHARALFQLGTYAQDEKKNDEALDFFEQAAAADSTFAAAFHNAGQIRQSRNSGDDLKQAAELFAKAAAADPSDFQYHAKLIQLYDSLGNADAREAARQNFKAAFDKGELNPNFLAVGRYNGAQLEVGDKFVMVFGHFKLLGSEPAKYQFVVYDKGQVREDKELYRVSLLAKDGKFLLDSFSSKERKHFKEYSSEPSYENVKQDVLSIINGATQPVSTTAL